MLKDPLSAQKPAARHATAPTIRRRKTVEYFFPHGEQLLGVVARHDGLERLLHDGRKDALLKARACGKTEPRREMGGRNKDDREGVEP